VTAAARKRTRSPRRRGVAAAIKKNPLSALAITVGACGVLLAAVMVAVIIALTALGAESRARGEKTDLLKLHLSELSDDYNALRRSLGLEPREFGQEPDAAGDAGGPPSGLAQGLAVIQSRYYDELKARRFTEFKTGKPFTALAAAIGCRPLATGLFSVALLKKNDIYFSISYAPDSGAVAIAAAGRPERHAGPWDDRAAGFMRDTVKKIDAYYQSLPAHKAALAALGAEEKIAAVLAARHLTLRPGGEDHARIRVVVARDKDDLLTVSFDKLAGVFLIGEAPVAADADLAATVLPALAALDARTTREKRFAAVTASLQAELADPGFAAAAAEAGMTAATAPRETGAAVYFDIVHRGVKIGAFAVMRDTADIYFVDRDDVQIQALRSVTDHPDFKKKSSRDDSSRDSPNFFRAEPVTTFLILGQNEENSDTTILLQADARTKSLVMVSLPRDLFYRGTRINKLPQAGFEQCASRISELAGVKISRYAAVDIHSLVALIDLLGGVDIELKQDLVDPTYRVKDDGVWRTLAYPRGRHHLSGVEALRVIRSRATSSDFNRSYRQQLVLEALFEKLKRSCGQNMDTALAVFSRLSGYVTTDLTPLEVARYFFIYKDFSITGRHVLDTTNILRQTYTMLHKLPEEEQEARMQTDKIEDLGGYILLPRNNDWDLFRSYVGTLFAAK
jgi:polyisoprenyl-teichoic acid--peptidoglycan teichoic acid transferase